MPRESHIPELKVLRRKDTSVIDENDWPQFDVHDVEVRGADGKLSSLFLADPGHPVTITGQLATKGSITQASLLPTHKTKPRVPILIENVTYFAFGMFDNGGYAIWAAGEAGWHTIYPAKSYESLYGRMLEGLSLLYHLVDAYDNGKKTSSADLFKSYAKEKKIPAEAAADLFYSHGAFLASRMVKGEEGIKWGHTSFYQHLRKAYPEFFLSQSRPAASSSAPPRATPAPAKSAPAKQSTTATRTAATRTQARETSSRSQSTEARPTRAASAAAATSTTKKVTRTAQSAQSRQTSGSTAKTRVQTKQTQQHAPLLSEMNKAKARDVWKFIQKKTNETLPEIAEMTVETFARFLFQEYHFEDENEAQYFLEYLAPDLVGMMSIRRNRSYDPWSELPIYDELMEAKVPARVRGKIAALQLKKRDKPLPGQEEDSEASDVESSEESVMDKEEATKRKRADARRRISALRPKSTSKYSGKAAKRKIGNDSRIDDDNDEEMLDADTAEDAMSVDTPSKRKGVSEDEDEEEEPEYPNKRFTRSQGNNDPELEDLEFEIQQARSVGLPVRRKPSQSSAPAVNSDGRPKVRMGLVSEPISSTDANAPGDVWNCPHEGCVHKVYGASEYESKELIREHLLDHKEKERVDLIKDEENMTRLPVNHLLKRLREFAERNGGEQLRPLEGGLMGLFPPPLERKVY